MRTSSPSASCSTARRSADSSRSTSRTCSSSPTSRRRTSTRSASSARSILVFDIYNPRNGEIYSRDPRQVAKKAEKYLASTGIADTAFFAPEAEFYIFDDVRYEVKQNKSYYEVDSDEAAWNTGREEEGGNLANKTPYKGGYFPVTPVDKHADLRDDIMLKLIEAGLEVERGHHEVGTAGQGEINYKFDTMVHAADDILKFKYIVKNTALEWGKVATFMPKPLMGDNGSGMHTHQSLWNDGKPLFYDEKGYGGLSATSRAGTSAAS